MEFNPKYFDFIKARVVGVTVPTVDFIPDSEGIISYCARVSNPSNQQNFESAAGLLKYCMKNGHWSVFDMANILIEVEVPRDIARQVLRHSSMKFQEFSQRYAEAQNFYVRETRLQDKKNRQNSIDLDLNNEEEFNKILEWEKRQGEVIALVKKHYAWAIENDIAKECARVILPEGNTMSYMYANTTVRSAITYLNVRDDEGVTQKEHVYLAKVIKPAIIEHFPFLEELLEK
nr:MAG TPA: FAD-dependent thymidylate synthase [Caudoviricetes sp.]